MTRRKFLIEVVGLIVLFISFLINLIFVFISEDNILNVIIVCTDIIVIIMYLVLILLKKPNMLEEYLIYRSNKKVVKALERVYKEKSIYGNNKNMFSETVELQIELIWIEMIKTCQTMIKINSKWCAKKHEKLLQRLEKIQFNYN